MTRFLASKRAPPSAYGRGSESEHGRGPQGRPAPYARIAHTPCTPPAEGSTRRALAVQSATHAVGTRGNTQPARRGRVHVFNASSPDDSVGTHAADTAAATRGGRREPGRPPPLGFGHPGEPGALQGHRKRATQTQHPRTKGGARRGGGRVPSRQQPQGAGEGCPLRQEDQRPPPTPRGRGPGSEVGPDSAPRPPSQRPRAEREERPHSPETARPSPGVPLKAGESVTSPQRFDYYYF